MDLFYWYGLMLILAWISIYMSSRVWDKPTSKLHWLDCLSLGMDRYVISLFHAGI